MAIKISKQWAIDMSKETIERIIKKLKEALEKNVNIRRSKTLDAWKVEVKKLRLLELKEQDEKG
ncbi:MAG: hypothetical protein F6K22_08225 [Okeania sp. SIO2F4]|uniref:hypothetical protein n=1 Tax=Okeania sp. SIO2F4 TaxID=2607790 RepID=UPI00142BCCB8|nr:hypothetical protein [Okeania sp. SIO2F4]NES02833.1 hypothetical protein [Okeania sp. SIO2F4]